MPSKISKHQFQVINREIKQHVSVATFDSTMLAAQFKVSRSTINTIRRAKTYPGFLALKARRHYSPKTDASEVELSKELDQLIGTPVEYVTTKQFTDAIDSLKGSIKEGRATADQNTMDIRVLESHDRFNTRILNRIQKLKPRWFQER